MSNVDKNSLPRAPLITTNTTGHDSSEDFSFDSWQRKVMASSKTPKISNRGVPAGVSTNNVTTRPQPNRRTPKPTPRNRKGSLGSSILQLGPPRRVQENQLVEKESSRPSPPTTKTRENKLTSQANTKEDNSSRNPIGRPPLHDSKSRQKDRLSSYKHTTRSVQQELNDKNESDVPTFPRQEVTNATNSNSNLQTKTKDIDDDMDCESGDDLCLNSSESSSSSSSPVSQSNVLRHERSDDSPPASKAQRRRDQVDNTQVFEMMINSENTSNPKDAEVLGSTIGDEDAFSRKSLDDETDLTSLATDDDDDEETSNSYETGQEESEDRQRDKRHLEESMDGDETVTDKSRDDEESDDDDDEKGSYHSSKRQLFNNNLSYALETDGGRQQSLKSDDESIEAWSIDGQTKSPIEIKINGKKYMHPPLPAGWRIEISKTHQRPIYIHPDMGRTFHCPIDLPHDVVYVKGADGKFIKRPKENNREIAPNSPRALRDPESPPSIHDNYQLDDSPRQRGKSPQVSPSHQFTGQSNHRSAEHTDLPPPSPSDDSAFQLLRDLSKLRASTVKNSSRNLKRAEDNLQSLKNSQKESSGSPSNLSDVVRLYEKEKPLNPTAMNSENCDDVHDCDDCHNSDATDSYMRRLYQTNHTSPQPPFSERRSEGNNDNDYDLAVPFDSSTPLSFRTKDKELRSSENFNNHTKVRFATMDSTPRQHMNRLDKTPRNVESKDSYFTPIYGKAEIGTSVPDQRCLRTHTPTSCMSKTLTNSFQSQEKSMSEMDEMHNHGSKSFTESSKKKLPSSKSKLQSSIESEQIEAWFTPYVSKGNKYNRSKHGTPKYVEVATLSHGKARGRSEKPMLISSIYRDPQKSQKSQEKPISSVVLKESRPPTDLDEQSVSSTPSDTLKSTNGRRNENPAHDGRANKNPNEDMNNKDTDDPLQRSFDIHEHTTPGKLHWQSPNCSGIQPQSDLSKCNKTIAAGRSSDNDHVDQETQDASSPAERDAMSSTSLSNSRQDRLESPERTHSQLRENVAETDPMPKIPASDSAKQMQNCTEEQPGTIGESSDQISELLVKGKEPSPLTTNKNLLENASTLSTTDKVSSHGVGKEENESNGSEPIHQSFNENNNDDGMPSQSVPGNTQIGTNAQVNGQALASAESPVDFGTFGDDFSDSSDDGYTSPKSTPSPNRKETERQLLDESRHSTLLSVESAGNPSESPDEKFKKPIAESSPDEFDHLGDSDDGSTEIPSPRMHSNDDDLQDDSNDKILDQESESSPLIKPKRRKLSWRAWNPPFTLCSLQRLDEIFAEQQKLRKKKRGKSVTTKRKTVKKAQPKKAKTKKKSRRG